MMGRMLAAYHREYLRALRQPPDARLRGLMNYVLMHDQRHRRQVDAVAKLQVGVVKMQASYLRQMIEAGQQDMARIKADFEKDGADREALLAQAQQIQAATAQAVEMLKTIETAIDSS